MSSNQKRIVEHFYSIQGEGSSVGRPCYFIRFAGCNLRCTWCDSKFASRPEHWSKDSFDIETADINIPESCDRVVFTGGEPTLQPLAQIAKWLCEKHGRNFIFECESNGTNQPTDEIMFLIDQWNLSPKLDGTQEDSISPETPLREMEFWADRMKNNEMITMKFVVGNEAQFNQVVSLVEKHKIPRCQVFCMREGIERERFTTDEFNKTLIDWCKAAGFNYSTRLHVVVWNKVTGV
jgi:organic radical activating enzyme